MSFEYYENNKIVIIYTAHIRIYNMKPTKLICFVGNGVCY